MVMMAASISVFEAAEAVCGEMTPGGKVPGIGMAGDVPAWRDPRNTGGGAAFMFAVVAGIRLRRHRRPWQIAGGSMMVIAGRGEMGGNVVVCAMRCVAVPVLCQRARQISRSSAYSR
jgi:hypothetical protein